MLETGNKDPGMDQRSDYEERRAGGKEEIGFVCSFMASPSVSS
jgi:hypothetical protein